MKIRDFLSERMVFGLLIVLGFLGAQTVLTLVKIPAENANLISQCVGALCASIGVIVAAVFKTDKVDRQNADTLSQIAAAMPNTQQPAPDP